MKLRIVYNAYSKRYRIARKRWWGWSFVTDPEGWQYLAFDSKEEAKTWIDECLASNDPPTGRWQVVEELAV
jgi:hypothetical protein